MPGGEHQLSMFSTVTTPPPTSTASSSSTPKYSNGSFRSKLRQLAKLSAYSAFNFPASGSSSSSRYRSPPPYLQSTARGYYRRFIKDYGKIAQPLTTLLKKETGDKFAWPDDAHNAFEALKTAVTNSPVLVTPDFSRPFIIECDASGVRIGAVLHQGQRPIAYFSKGLSVAEEHNDRNEMLRQLRYHLENAQNKMAKAANTKRRELQFSEGDKVLLKLRPHRQSTIHHRINQKLAPRFYGPFTILQKYSAVSYKLALPDTAKVHPIFHVSQLRRVTGNHTAVTDLPKDMAVTEPGFDPQDILNARQQNGVHQVLVKWEGRPEEEATWIDRERPERKRVLQILRERRGEEERAQSFIKLHGISIKALRYKCEISAFAQFSASINAVHGKWMRSNKMCLNLMKITIAENMKPMMPKVDIASEFLAKVKELSMSEIVDKSIAGNLMT
nr:hypothetical protein KK1_034095 [Ipomoea trifida]